MPENEQKNFAITRGRGFQMTFENGWTVSVQFGPGNYCEHHHDFADYDEPSKHHVWQSNTAEIAAWDANDVWYEFEYDKVDGWKKSNEVAEFIAMIAAK